ncbi:Chemotaxis protein methyltransferase CheR (plasmid) [Sinorhizobium sojae CCBAU 05684]|uniref:Chemotaxis protein methyltransferase CheR n=1 Tax=Sinorhizobium sojae CCBAU 05684 TaxID=716928 RepID=A0A249PII5_9HYPH|nr:protein-glutamate O-methyltransferase CheR [Sinorhizobium sojae]ASY65504.1 Chemotaxis protein methyltransferase CheR [Sinorhizobium sojae CCBAU 05684]
MQRGGTKIREPRLASEAGRSIRPESTIDASITDAVAAEIARQMRLSVTTSRSPALAAAVQRVMSRHGITDPQRLRDRIAADGALREEVLNEATVRETHFFRDSKQFELLRHTILPRLCRRRAGAPARIWSAGCASGEEPYSLAILCAEDGYPARISASDISIRAIAEAVEAEYGEWSLRDTGEYLKRRYFLQCGDRYRLRTDVARSVRFTRLNLGFDTLPAPDRGLAGFDLILCRNVLVYLDAADLMRVAEELFTCLAEGGWLLTAPTDPPLWKYASFQTATTGAGLVYRKPMHVARQAGAERVFPTDASRATGNEARHPKENSR